MDPLSQGVLGASASQSIASEPGKQRSLLVWLFGWNGAPIRGSSIDMLDVAKDYPWLSPDSIQAKDIERFRWFSEGFLARNPDDHLMIIDVRYSFLPNELSPLWVIRLKPEAPRQHVDYLVTRDLTPKQRLQFLEMLF